MMPRRVSSMRLIRAMSSSASARIRDVNMMLAPLGESCCASFDQLLNRTRGIARCSVLYKALYVRTICLQQCQNVCVSTEVVSCRQRTCTHFFAVLRLRIRCWKAIACCG